MGSVNPEPPDHEDKEEGSRNHGDDALDLSAAPAEVSVEDTGNEGSNGEPLGNGLVVAAVVEPEGGQDKDGNDDEDNEEEHAEGAVTVHEAVTSNPGSADKDGKEENTGKRAVAEEAVDSVVVDGVALTNDPSGDGCNDDGSENQKGDSVILETSVNVDQVCSAAAGRQNVKW